MSHRLRLPALALAALALGAAPAAPAADTQYVIEQLAVSVAAQPDGSGEHVATLHSGDAVEVLERQEDRAHVRLASGAEGWVRASYLMAGPPLRAQLAERTQERDALQQQLMQLEADLAAARAAPATRPAAPAADLPSPETHPADVPLFSGVGGGRYRPGWALLSLVTLAALGLGFGLGWRALDRRIRSKYGGLRIY